MAIFSSTQRRLDETYCATSPASYGDSQPGTCKLTNQCHTNCWSTGFGRQSFRTIEKKESAKAYTSAVLLQRLCHLSDDLVDGVAIVDLESLVAVNMQLAGIQSELM